MRRAAIGIFDSGIGGLTVAAEIARRLPHEDMIYLGDTARLPYGTKSATTVARYAERATSLLLRYPVKAMVVACNTASAHALDSLRQMTDIPVLGVIEPGARTAVDATRNGHVGVVGTEATIRSQSYQQAILALRGDTEITATPWPLLVSMAEEGWIDHPVARLTISTYLKPFASADIDTLVLGCTHYPVFKEVIAEILATEYGRPDVTLVDSAEAVTVELNDLLKAKALEAPERDGRRSFFCTDLPERFARVGGHFFNGDVSGITAVDL